MITKTLATTATTANALVEFFTENLATQFDLKNATDVCIKKVADTSTGSVWLFTVK